MFTIRDLSAETLPDFLHFFDHVAFSDNPKWASCYCHFPHADHVRVEWSLRSGASNRAAVCGLAMHGRMQGLLAYREGMPVGWCNAGPRPLIDNLMDPDPDGSRIGAIACFVIAPGSRRHGIASRLLAAACERFKAQGFALAEGYAVRDSTSITEMHHGPIAMYERAGFSELRVEEHLVVMRKVL
jgi:ribosomal protein S18 acetylase RimI-like enzyme